MKQALEWLGLLESVGSLAVAVVALVGHLPAGAAQVLYAAQTAGLLLGGLALVVLVVLGLVALAPQREPPWHERGGG